MNAVKRFLLILYVTAITPILWIESKIVGNEEPDL